MALITRTLTKTMWGITDSSQDDVIDRLILQCQDRIETWCGRRFDVADHTEILEGNGDRMLPVRQRPINSIASVYVDQSAAWGDAPDAFAAATLLESGVDYTFVKDGQNSTGKSGLLVRINGSWPRPIEFNAGRIMPRPATMGNVKVTYNAGYSPALSLTVTVVTAGTVSTPAVQTVRVLGLPLASSTWTLGGATLAHDVSAAALGTAVSTALGLTVTATGSMSAGFTVTWSANGARSALTGDVSTLTQAALVMPYDLEQACLLLMANVKRILKVGAPIQSEGWEGYNRALASAAGEAMGGLPPDVLWSLSKYKNPAVG
jgi:hypothetical protein